MTTALAQFTQSIVSSNDEMQRMIEKVKSQTIPLFPDTVNFGIRPEFKLSATLVTVDTQNNRDVYKNESGGYSLHLTKLNEIAQSAGLVITDSRILEHKTDERGRVTYISHQVKWKMKSIDGSTKEGVITGKYDYYNDKETKKEGQVKSRRKHAEALAESNALVRAFNKAVAKLPQSFSLQELKKPFFVPCVIEDKNELLKDLDSETQRQIKAEYARKQLGISNSIYGNAAAPQLPEQTTEKPPLRIVKGSGGNNNNNVTDANVIEEQGGMSEEEQNHILAEEFRTAPQNERTEKILNLIKIKRFEDPSGAEITASRIERQSIDGQIKFIEKLLNIKDEMELPI